MSGSCESWGLNSTHIHGTHVPVEEPSTASGADIRPHIAGLTRVEIGKREREHRGPRLHFKLAPCRSRQPQPGIFLALPNLTTYPGRVWHCLIVPSWRSTSFI